MPSCQSGRIEKVQVLRAVAIIGVVLIHTTPTTPPPFPYNGSSQVIYRPFINYAVALFLFLSGYLTNTEITDTLGFCKKRIERIFIPYVIWSVLYTLAYWVGRNESPRIFWNLLTTRASYHLYYVFVYIQFVLLTPFLKKTLKSPWRWLAWTVAPISTLIFSYTRFFAPVAHIAQNRLVSYVWSVNCLGWFTAYYLGLALGNGAIQKDFHQKKLLFLYALSIPIQMLEGHFWFLRGEVNCGTQVKLSAFLTNAIFLLLAYCYLSNGEKVRKAKPLVALGDASFGVYLCHPLWISALGKVPGYSNLPYVANSVLVLSVSFVSVSVGRKICGPKLSKWLGLI